jgi:hypothetical protein
MYCGEAAEMIQPLLLIGIKTPISMARLRTLDAAVHARPVPGGIAPAGG